MSNTGYAIPNSLLTPVIDAWSFGCVLWELALARKERSEQHEQTALFPLRSEKHGMEVLNEYCKERHAQPRWAHWHSRILQAGQWAETIRQLCHPDVHKRQKALAQASPENFLSEASM